MRKTGGHQALVEVETMGFEDVLMMEQAPGKSEQRVKKEGPDQQHTGQREAGIELRRNQGQDREGIPQESAADIPHEDTRPQPIVKQQPEGTGGQDPADPGNKGLAAQQTQDGPTGPSNHGLRGGNIVYTVHEIIGIDHAHDPQERDRQANPAEIQLTDKGDL